MDSNPTPDPTTPEGFSAALQEIVTRALANRSVDMFATMTERMAQMTALTIVVGTGGRAEAVNALCGTSSQMMFEHAAQISRRLDQVNDVVKNAVLTALKNMPEGDRL